MLLSETVTGSNNATTQFDGIRFYPSSGNMTGRLTVYGYRS